jgi:hypothetical protein
MIILVPCQAGALPASRGVPWRLLLSDGLSTSRQHGVIVLEIVDRIPVTRRRTKLGD